MNKKDIEKILKNWFIKKKKKFIFDSNLFNEGIIDSFEVIDFVSYIEANFEIKFNSNEFQNPKLMIIKNLIKIIEKKISV